MKRASIWTTAMLAGGLSLGLGCKKDAPKNDSPPAAPAGDKTECEQIIDLSLSFLDTDPAVPAEQRAQMKASFADPGTKEALLDKCAKAPPERRACQLKAKAMADLAACKVKFSDAEFGSGVAPAEPAAAPPAAPEAAPAVAPTEPAPAPVEPTPAAAVPPAPAPAGDGDLCTQALAHMVAVVTKDPNMPAEAKDGIAKTLLAGPDREKALAECRKEPEDKVRCMLNAQNVDGFSACARPTEPAVIEPAPALPAPAEPGAAAAPAADGDLCSQAIVHLVEVFGKDPNMPPEAKAEMAKAMQAGPEREKALAECRQEPEEKVRCMLKAESIEGFNACNPPKGG